MENIGDSYRNFFCVPFVCKSENGSKSYGTGVVFRTMNKDYDLVLTAGHCITSFQPSSIQFQNIKLEPILIIKPDKYEEATEWDFCVMVIGKAPSQVVDLEISLDSNGEYKSKYILYGYPEAKRKTENPLNEILGYDIISTTDKPLILKLDTSISSLDYSLKELMNGMSGGAVIDTTASEIIGLFTHTTVPDGSYKDICCARMEKISKWMHEIGLIFYEEGNRDYPCIFEPFINNEEECEDGECISAILIGKSGAGKSAFAKTFLKNTSIFDSTGQTRTTRSTIKYKIHLYCKTPKIRVQLFNKKDFINFRLKRCYEILEAKYKYSTSVTSTKVGEMENEKYISFSSCCLKKFEIANIAFANDAFFNYQEFMYLDDTIGQKIQKSFNIVFGNESDNIKETYSKEEYYNICQQLKQTDQDEQDNDHNQNEDVDEKFKKDYILDDLVSLLFGKIYEILLPYVNNRYNFTKHQKEIEINGDLDPTLQELINYSLKVCDNKSLTGFVKSVTIEDSVSDEYVKIFLGNNMVSLTLLDTYGLDHAVQITPEALEKRLWEISQDNEDVDYIFYIRKLGSDAPSDLESIIPKIYTAHSRLRVYTIFTAIDENSIIVNEFDENGNCILNLLDLNEKHKIPAINYFVEEDNGLVPTKHPIVESLISSKVSEPFAKNIYQNILDHLIPYCAKEDIEVRKLYNKNNIYHVNLLFQALLNKEYLGKGLINIKYMEKTFKLGHEEENVKLKLIELLKSMFETASLNWYRGIYECGNWRTQQANIKCIREGVLGFSGTHNHEWNERFYSSYNKVFSKLSEDDFNLLFSTSEGLNDGTAIQQLINNFGKVFLGCPAGKTHFTFPVKNIMCDSCNVNICFRSILLQAYAEGELKEHVNDTRVDWLNARCDFGERFFKIQEEVYVLFIKEFSRVLIPEARAHNARKIANLIKSDTEVMNQLDKVISFTNDSLKNMEDFVNNKRLGEIIKEIN